MNKPIRSLPIACLICMALGLSLLPDLAWAAPLRARLAASEEVLTTSFGSRQQARAEEYWTPERMAAAQPMPFPTPTASRDDGPMPLGKGEQAFVAGGKPDPDSRALARRLYPEDWLAPISLPTGRTPGDLLRYTEEDFFEPSTFLYSYPPPYAFYPANGDHMWKFYPWMTIGKLFFTTPSGGNSYCSASVAVGRAVWTAGHCVYSPGAGWHTNVTFVPAFRNGARPYGTFNVTHLATLGGWRFDGNQAFDIGMVAVADKSGRTVGQWVGWLGALFFGSPTQFWHSNGYPGAFGGGQRLYVCEGSLSARWSLPGPDPVGMGCRMQHGSSGGPWITKFVPYSAGARNYVNSVVTGSPTPSLSHQFFGPYFGGGAQNLYNWGKAK